MTSEESVKVNETVVSCDGNGISGHPLVYLNLGNNHQVQCPYCGKKFILHET